jgi:2-(1,2-epoxy-1,2-dihydrophenyl)acetyl-CoA isomerase
MDRIRATFEAFGRGDAEAIIAEGVDPNVEFKTAIAPLQAPGGVYRGLDGVREWVADVTDAFEDPKAEIDELHDLGDGRYLGSGRYRGRGKESGAEFDIPIAWVWIVHGGLMRRFEAHRDRSAALDSLGLDEWPEVTQSDD